MIFTDQEGKAALSNLFKWIGIGKKVNEGDAQRREYFGREIIDIANLENPVGP